MTQGSGREAESAGLAFEGSTGYLLSRAGAAARRGWAKMLADQGLTPHHFGILMAVGERGRLGQGDLGELLGIDPRNVVPIIDGLEERGLLIRSLDPVDRRRRTLTLTESGRTATRRLAHTGDQLESRFLRTLDADDRRTLHRLLLAVLAASSDE